ncbi:MAG: hypothetical protein JW769_05465 [Parachlamydiales bacterium]|nr:hypothetical protein [Parachlamydiales bacterium]
MKNFFWEIPVKEIWRSENQSLSSSDQQIERSVKKVMRVAEIGLAILGSMWAMAKLGSMLFAGHQWGVLSGVLLSSVGYVLIPVSIFLCAATLFKIASES